MCVVMQNDSERSYVFRMIDYSDFKSSNTGTVENFEVKSYRFNVDRIHN